MSSALTTKTTRSWISFPPALAITLTMAVFYTSLDTLQPDEPVYSLLAFLPGAISLAALMAAGIHPTAGYLRFAQLSRPGMLALGITTLLLLPILGSSTGFSGWQWLPGLVYAPASGIAQELYFRASLLSALERAFRGRQTLALLIHSAIFVGFHLRTFLALPSWPVALVVATVLFLGGCGWGWQVQRDHTVVWAMLQHSLFLVLMSMFGWI